jgi:hypothetical protein
VGVYGGAEAGNIEAHGRWRGWKTEGLLWALAERLDIRRILTIDGDFAAVRMGKRWRKGFELVVPVG